jgi:hypothetical protein
VERCLVRANRRKEPGQSGFHLLRVLATPPPRRQLTVDCQRTTRCNVTFEVFTAVTMKNVVFWDVAMYGSSKNRRYGGTYRLRHQGNKNR